MMLPLLIGLLLPRLAQAGTPLIVGDVPEGERLRRLRPLFAPPPGEVLTIGQDERRDFELRANPMHLRGWISVTPPRGSCLTVERAKDQPDERICKKTKLAFTFADLDRAGRLSWTVKTGDGDFGTDLHWQTPYRLGSVIPYGVDAVKDPPTYKYLAECVAERTAVFRRIRLRLLDGQQWIIHFPDHDQLAPQPEPIANLYIKAPPVKRGVAKEAEKKGGGGEGKNKAEEGHPKAEGKESSESKESKEGHESKDGKDNKEGKEGEAASAEPTKPAIPDPEDDRREWAIPLRDAYVMNADAFQPTGAVAHGLRGECRYIFSGPPEDPATGRLECHGVDGYQQVYLPLTCLKDLSKV